MSINLPPHIMVDDMFILTDNREDIEWGISVLDYKLNKLREALQTLYKKERESLKEIAPRLSLYIVYYTQLLLNENKDIISKIDKNMKIMTSSIYSKDEVATKFICMGWGDRYRIEVNDIILIDSMLEELEE